MNSLRVFVCVLLAAAGSALGESSATARAQALKQRYMAPCCWSETLAEHHSPVASELNAEIDRWVREGVPDKDIELRLVARYGRRILVEPGGAQGAVLRIVPVAALIGGAVWIGFLLRRWLRPRPSAAT